MRQQWLTLTTPLLALLFHISTSGAPRTSASEDTRQGCLQGAGKARLYYRVIGSTQDTIVVVHGGPGAGMNALFPDLEPLGKNHTVIFYDQRGGGRSELPADTSRLHARFFVEDLEAVRRHFGLSRMTVVAHSFGAILLARYLQAFPQRIARAVFLGATGPKRREAGKLAQQRYAEMDSTTFERLGKIMHSLFTGTAKDPVAACREYENIWDQFALSRGEPRKWRGSTCDASPEAVAYYYRYTARHTPATFGEWDFANAFSEVAAPVLVVYGGLDSSALPQQRAWAEAFPNGRLWVIPNAGKGALADRPDLVHTGLRTFLQGQWPEGAE